MPFPVLLVVGGVAAAASLGMSGYAVWKRRKIKRDHDERFVEVKTVQEKAEAEYDGLINAGRELGDSRVQASKVLEAAARYLRAVAKELELESLPEIPDEFLEEWVTLRSEIAQSISLGVGGAAAPGATAAGGGALYTAAGLFGVSSTGTRIAGLSGAAAHSARLAWIGGGAVATGGGGVALGSTILNLLTKANVVTAPLGLGVAAWQIKKVHDLEKEVAVKLEEFAEAEIKLGRKIMAMQNSVPRLREIQESIESTDRALQDLLSKAKAIPAPGLEPAEVDVEDTPQPDLHLPHQIYLTAKALRELIEQPGISNDIRRIIEE